MNETIAIRADGNSKIGFGHLMRMKALAQEFRKLGAEVIFNQYSNYPVHFR